MEFLSKHKRLFLACMIILCVALAIVSINLRQRPTAVENALAVVIIPAQKALTTAGSWAQSKLKFLSDLDDMENLNASLQGRVMELEAEVSRLKLMEIENQELSALLEISQKYGNYEKVGAHIVAKDMGNWYNRFTIDKGMSDGIKKDMVVLGTAGLIGTVTEVGANYSKIVSLIDSTSSISAKTVRTDDIGFVKGDFDLMEAGFCRMEKIDVHAEIAEGDEVVTSQLSSIYQPGLTIGVVEEIIPDANGLTKHAIIRPAEDFKHLRTVLVVTTPARPEITFKNGLIID